MTPDDDAEDKAEAEESSTPARLDPAIAPLAEEFAKLCAAGWPGILIVVPREQDDTGTVLGNVRNATEIFLMLHQAFVWARSVADSNGDKETSDMLEPFINDLKYMAPRVKNAEKPLGELLPGLGQGQGQKN